MSAFRLTNRREAPEMTVSNAVRHAVEQTSEIILGKEVAIQLAFACLIARGHLLIEDVPGVGKTTLAHTLAKVTGLSFQRIQFTSDMLPADILGMSVYDRATESLKFHPGPIFSQLIVADEVNRATPKSQSALLEAMEEHQVTLDGETRHLPEPFFVIATQNPARQVGTFPLPESQLDRFLMRIELGYPGEAAERELLKGQDRRELLLNVTPCMTKDELVAAQKMTLDVHVSEALLDYIQALVSYTRDTSLYELGLSPRAAVALVRASQAWALTEDRDHVVPEDVQTILPSVVGHRLRRSADAIPLGSDELARELITQVPIP